MAADISDLVTFDEFITHWAADRPQRIAMREEDRLFTYAELEERTARVASALRAAGVEKGDRIAWIGKNSDLYFTLFFGAARVGVVMAPIGWRLSPTEWAYIVNDTRAKIVFTAASAPLKQIAFNAGLEGGVVAEKVSHLPVGQGLDAATRARRIAQLSDALDMRDILERRTEGFSQGQRVKTAIARALVHEPKNIILDEPTNGLDVMATRAMRTFMLHLKAQGHCVLFSSHIMQEVGALCDRIVVIARGRVVADESPEALRAQTGAATLEDAFVKIIGSEEGLAA